jgi:hypothetical protein
LCTEPNNAFSILKGRPGKPDTRAEVVVVLNNGLAFPAKAEVKRKVIPEPPIVLNEEAGVSIYDVRVRKEVMPVADDAAPRESIDTAANARI